LTPTGPPPGSPEGIWFALDRVPPLQQADQDHFRRSIVMLHHRWQNYAFNVDMSDMIYLDDHNDITAYLNAHWGETVHASTSELFLASGLDAIAEHDDDRAPFAIAVYLNASLRGVPRLYESLVRERTP
jgi:hypothetical protein